MDESGNSSVKEEEQVTSIEPQKLSKPQDAPEPRPPRRLRLNRRSFALSTILDDVKPLSEIKSYRKIHFHSKSSDSANSDPEVSSNKEEPLVSEKRKIISLTSAKNGFSNKDESELTKCIDLDSHDKNSKTGILRSVHVGEKNVTVNVENSSSQEAPPRKKHKPITWP